MTSSLVRKFFLIPEEAIVKRSDRVFIGQLDSAPEWIRKTFEILTDNSMETAKKEK